MTSREIKRRLPNASEAFIKRNAEDYPAALPTQHKEPVKGSALERVPKRAKKGSDGPIERIGLRFCVWAVRPADPDGWDFKEIIDALVGAKVLDGDEWDKFYIAGVYSEKVYSKDEERTEISIIYPTQVPQVSDMTHAQLIEAYWATCGSSWNRAAFDVFMETMDEETLRQYIQMGTT